MSNMKDSPPPPPPLASTFNDVIVDYEDPDYLPLPVPVRQFSVMVGQKNRWKSIGINAKGVAQSMPLSART
ncbi:hypothetical protein A7M48_21175 [Acinetobacter baumannii]|nr:hypothetical protein A7M48_21175 [Acinetobacter baumannii]